MQVVSVQTGVARPVQSGGRTILTAIAKTARIGPVVVQPLGLDSDEQVDLTVHGGLEKAIYAYPHEHYPFWEALRSEAGLSAIDPQLPPGSMGENLTLTGLLETDLWLGDRLEFPDCTLRVTQPREPCLKFNLALGMNTAVRQMARSGFCGFYLAVDRPGTIAAGVSFSVIPGLRQTSVSQRFQQKMLRQST